MTAAALRGRMAVVAAVVAVVVACGTGMWATRGARTTADEPHYLLTATSIGEDLSLDVSDERAGLRYVPYHQVGLLLQEKVQADGRLVSPHDPLLPAILAAPMRLGGWVAAKLTLAVIAGAVAAATLWLAVRRFGVSSATATGAALLAGVSPPLAVYGTQVYPEIVGALAVVIGVAAVTGALGRREVVLAVAAVTALPWLSVKYAPTAAAIVLALAVRLAQRRRWRDTGLIGAVLAVMGIAFVVLHQRWYGGVTAYAAGSHFVGGELTVVGDSPDYASRTVRLTALLTDRNYGLVVWQPAFALAFPAVGALVRRRPPHAVALLGVLAAGWATATWLALTMHGFWWPGRQTVVVLPLVVVAIARWIDGVRWRQWLGAVLGVAGVANYAWVAVESSRRQLRLAVDPQTTAAPAVRLLRTLFVDYTRTGSAGSVHHVGITALCVVAVGLGMWMLTTTDG